LKKGTTKTKKKKAMKRRRRRKERGLPGFAPVVLP